ncbi:hypothetical protein ACJQ64_003572 [Yersinia enterocolitica]|uniref:hypothetical protein n=1 Tax=Yersinia intermedia TaxID=631 RepID=UPI000B41EC25|nr:hypothetical protein [Yersinia intermedia]ELI7902392.1 hypothetical protein [Yersinia enterocolitica]ELI8005615.1 hypothetical protein [Yersinia enterocolitica]ELX2217367.1 hypothetical protein [Yersinia enterocolitica]OVZ72852.1 hypothetical protein CBW55_23175 [Yersinia intermedia]
MNEIMDYAITARSVYLGPSAIDRVIPWATSTTFEVASGSNIKRKMNIFASDFNDGNFNFDLCHMKKMVESDLIKIPTNLTSVEDLDAWLMGLNIE